MTNQEPDSDARNSVVKLLELEVEIVEQARAALARQRGIDVSRASFRDVAAFAVAMFLPEITRKMEECALEKAAPNSRRPRKLDAATWDQLGVQSGRLETSRIVLMRACLRLLARSSDQA